MSHQEFKRTARISDAARQEVLDRMDHCANADREAVSLPQGNQRKDARWSFRQSDVAVTVEHPAGGLSRLLLFSRNLSAGGMSFVHNGFLYPRSRCKVTLPKIDGQSQVIGGTIITCRHIHGLMHEIGLKFERKIDPSMFLGAQEHPSDQTADSMELPELHGRVLVVESCEIDARLLQHHLKLSGITPTIAPTTGAALDLVKQQAADIVLCELNIDGCDGVEFVQKLREAQFVGPVMVISADTDQARIDQVRQAGAEQFLAKPYDAGELLKLMVELNQKIGTVLSRASLYSSVEDQPGMAELVVAYIDQVRQLSRRIEQAVAGDKLKDLRQLCLNLKGSASGYGFEPLGELATQAIAAIDAGQTPAQVGPRVRTMCMLCQRLRTRPNVNPKTSAGRNASNAA